MDIDKRKAIEGL